MILQRGGRPGWSHFLRRSQELGLDTRVEGVASLPSDWIDGVEEDEVGHLAFCIVTRPAVAKVDNEASSGPVSKPDNPVTT